MEAGARDDRTARAAAARSRARRSRKRSRPESADGARQWHQPGLGAPRRGAQARHAGAVSLAAQRRLRGRTCSTSSPPTKTCARPIAVTSTSSSPISAAAAKRSTRRSPAGWIASPANSIRWNARCCGSARTSCAPRPTCRIAWSSTRRSGLAKRFGATDSHKFVNAVLDAAANELRPHEH